MSDNSFNVDKLISNALNPKGWLNTLSLKEIFDFKLEELNISKNFALKIMDIETKSFENFMQEGSSKIDHLIALKMAIFLEMSPWDFVDKFMLKIKEENSRELEKTKVRYFIARNFDLNGLRNIGFIDSVNDFYQIEKRILDFFGFSSVFQYRKEVGNLAYSSGKLKSNIESQKFWINIAYSTFEKIINSNEYDRASLVKLFPTLRAYSLNLENGLSLAMKLLFKIGITVIFIPKIHKDLHIRAATFCINDKPCIALTNYRDLYPTLWFALIHELYHVLYDWNEISDSENQSHLSMGISTEKINEDAANDFARRYLLDDEKMKILEDNIDDGFFVQNFALTNNTHPSILYALYAFENSSNDNKLFAKYKHLIPSARIAINNLNASLFENYTPIAQIAQKITSILK